MDTESNGSSNAKLHNELITIACSLPLEHRNQHLAHRRQPLGLLQLLHLEAAAASALALQAPIPLALPR